LSVLITCINYVTYNKTMSTQNVTKYHRNNRSVVRRKVREVSKLLESIPISTDTIKD